MGLLGKLMDNFKAADFDITANMKVKTLQSEFNNQIYDIILDNGSSSGSSIYYYGVISGETYDSLSGYTAQTNVFGTDGNSSTGYDYTDSNNDPWYYALFDNNSHTVSGYSGYSFYSNVSSLAVTSTSNNCATFYSMSVDGVQGSINYNTNTIDVCLPVGTTLGGFYVGYSACTEPENITVNGTIVYNNATPVQFSSGTAIFQVVSNDGTVTEEWTVNTTVSDPCNPCTTGNTGTGNVGSIKVCYQGTLSGTIFVYSGTPFLDYDDLVIATLRSRGVANYSTDNGAVYEVTGTSDVTLITTGSTYSASTKNPYSKFGINVTNNDGDTFQFQTSFTNSDSEYLPKVFGSSNFSKPRQTVPLFVEERYQNLLN